MTRIWQGLTLAAAAAALVTAGVPSGTADASTLENVKANGTLTCGANGARAGFSALDSEGRWQGLDVDTCRAVAAAVLQDADKAEFVRVTTQTRFTALQTGEIDLLTANATWTFQRDTALGINFVATTFYDGQGFMVPKALEISSIDELDGASVCVLPGSTSERVVEQIMSERGLDYRLVVFEDQRELSNAFFGGRCDVHVQSTSGLSASRATLASNPDDFVILPGIFDKDPMGPAVRKDDMQWRDIVQWVIYAMVHAEEYGVTSENVDEMRKTGPADIQRMLGESENIGEPLGLDAEWAYRVIKQVGNYGEVFERNVGMSSPLRLERGINAQWTDGGLMYAPPLK
jgi:general L-amino acid transport system substrate-binding protein